MKIEPDPTDGRILTRKEGAILVITIDRPAKLNGFSAVMLDELSEAFTQMENDTAIRCGVLRANGKNFTAGLELSKLAGRFAEGKSLFPPDKIDPVNLRRLRNKPGGRCSRHLFYSRHRTDARGRHGRGSVRLPVCAT